MSNRNRRPGRPDPSSSIARGTTPASAGATRPSSSPANTPRAGRRVTPRRRYDESTWFERFRRPIIALAVAVAVVGTALFVLQSASAASYTCSTIFEPGAAAQQEGRLGAVQPDMGGSHVGVTDVARYPSCPPASGDMTEQAARPGWYGPNDRLRPQQYIHTLEHGGLVVLYSCAESLGGCPGSDELARLEAFVRDFDQPSAICRVAPGQVGPVVGRFDEMARRIAVLTWGRVLYMDAFDPELATQMYLVEGERAGESGTLLMPPEAACTAPSPSPDASPSASPSGSPAASASPRASAAASASTSPSAAPSPSAS